MCVISGHIGKVGDGLNLDIGHLVLCRIVHKGDVRAIVRPLASIEMDSKPFGGCEGKERVCEALKECEFSTCLAEGAELQRESAHIHPRMRRH
jgi:hypothetical protein